MKKLKKAYIEITNCCNLSCTFCPGTSRKPAFMGIDSFRTVLEKLSGLTDYLYLHVMGEPLLHPDMASFLKLSDEFGYKVNITTNGLLIREMSDVLIDGTALRQVNFSLHSQEEVTDASKLGNYLDDIFRFTQRALARGDLFISYRLWNLSSGASDKYNSLVVQKLEQVFGPGFSIPEAMRHSERIKLRERLFLNSAEVFRWPSVTADEVGNEGFCLGLRDQIAVLVDGTVVPCCLDGDGVIRLGNIFEEDIGRILEGERARVLYEGFSGRRAMEELCRKCGYRTRFSKESEPVRRIYNA